LLAFFGTRTYHRGVVRIEDAGFEIRDQIQWIYGSGFPKSHDVAKGIDVAKGKKISENRSMSGGNYERLRHELKTLEAKQWDGWGTALKPANEPIVVARKPLDKGLTIAENVLKYGTGAINVDAGRIATSDEIPSTTNQNIKNNSYKTDNSDPERDTVYTQHAQGRRPANVILDEQAAEMLDEQSGTKIRMSSCIGIKRTSQHSFNIGQSKDQKGQTISANEYGGASRFFYVAKASKSEKNKGLEGLPLVESGIKNDSGRGFSKSDPYKIILNQNFHPTVKPIKLMQYLIKLVTPPNGTVLDPFMGSGSTGVAAKELGFNFVGCELSPEYFEIAQKRVNG